MRYENWETLLQTYIESKLSIPFQYGKQDCCKFASGAIKTITGIDVLDSLDYKKEIKNYKKNKSIFREYVSKIINDYIFLEINPLEASRGDMVLCNLENGYIVGICVGTSIILPSKTGLVTVSILEGVKAWRIN